MSGHSKWATIKHKKQTKDLARGKLFTKLGREIQVAASQGGADTSTNFALRLAVSRAKSANMPTETIRKLIQKASGQNRGAALLSVTYEVYGPAGSMIMVDTLTDNTNRTITDIKMAINKAGGKLASPGSLSWQFNELGLITLAVDKVNIEELVLKIMEIEGVIDIITEQQVTVIVAKERLQAVRDKLMAGDFQLTEVGLARVPEATISLSQGEQSVYQELVDALEQIDDVEQIWSNVIS